MADYLRQIDALRFYAVFGVMISHLYPKELPVFPFISNVYHYVTGVPLFFCISGFLITGILIAHAHEPLGSLLKNFYARRFLRIFPVYYLTIFILFIININDYRSWFVYDLFYVSNIAQALHGDFHGSIAPHFWSLAVEEQFYLFWPLLLLIPRSKPYFIMISVAIFMTGMLLMLFAEDRFFMARTFGCLSYLGSGAVLAAIWYYYRPAILRFMSILNFSLISLFLVIVVDAAGYLAIDQDLRLLISIFVIPMITLRFALGFQGRLALLIVENPIILYLGKISYGIYIFHLLALYPAVAIKKIAGVEFLENLWAMFFFKIFLTVVISALSWELFEKPINRLKRKFEYKQKQV